MTSPSSDAHTLATPTGAGGGAVIEAVLWDFGGVFTQSPFHHLDDYAAQLGTTAGELVDLVLGYNEPDGDHPWHRLERGQLTMREASAAVAELVTAAGYVGFTITDFFATMGGMEGGHHRSAMFDIVAAVGRSGRRNAIVSNNIAELSSRWRPLLPDGLFDDVIDSSEVGVRKPDPAIFALTLERLGGIAPERAVFLDDHLGNVEAAREFGLHALLVGAEPLHAGDDLLALLDLTPR